MTHETNPERTLVELTSPDGERTIIVSRLNANDLVQHHGWHWKTSAQPGAAETKDV